ncbi:MAG: cation:proton antiporter, partial [Actinomycetota bacterium]|nr:cation:proton antiporter [Actinomycetota bacterium]
MPLAAAAAAEVAPVLVELGLVVLALAVLARLADRVGLSPIPFYLVAGLLAGDGGLIELNLSQDLVDIGSEVGVVLLLLTLGLEYTSEELGANLRVGLAAGAVDALANALPGVVFGLVLGWDPRAAILLGGVTYISSSG